MFETVSIIMCTYNGEKFISEQIQSILDQTFDDYKLYIVDDTSTDTTVEIIKDFYGKSPDKITFVQNEHNLGFSANFAKGLALAQGKYVAISDQDDIWLPHRLEVLVNKMKEDASISLLHHKELQIINEQIQQEEIPIVQWAIDYEGSNFKRFCLINVIAGHLMLFKRELLADVLPIPPTYYYDWWIATVATLKGKIAYVNEVLVYHRMHGNNAWFNADRSSKVKEEHIYDEFLYKRLPYLKRLSITKNSDRIFLNSLENYCLRHMQYYKGIKDYKFFAFLWWNRNNIFPTKSKYRILQEYSMLKRCRDFYQK